MTMRSLKYLSVAMLFAVSSCTYNQYTTTRGGYDDLYGGRYDDAAVVADNRSALPMDYNTNPDYQGGSENAAATDQYYDENYITARNIQRNVSNQVGYNAGFTDGYFAGRNAGFFNNFYGGMYPSWGYPGFNIGFRMGMGSMIGLGYSPFGWNRWNRWGSFYDPYWDAMAWGDPFMYGGYGHPFYGGFGYPYYGGLGYGMYGYNPYRWSNYYPIIVNNNYGDGVRTRNYGPRPSGSSVSRTASSVSRREPGTTPVARSGARTSTSRNNTASNDGYYTRPRSAVSGSTREAAGNSSSRVSGTRGGTASGNYYYARPNSDRSNYGGSSSARTRSNSTYRASESGRSSSGYYSAPSRSNNSYSAPSRSYSAPSSTPSRSYSTPSAPSRSYSAPSSAPSRSYSAPSSSGGGRSSGSSGGGGRGPR